MASYRFCRTDDVPLLVHAHNACFLPHFPGMEPMTVESFRRAAKEIDLWASSCMVALDGGEPIGVLLACKRETQTLVWRVGIHPGHLRHGHGRHLMTSLGAKLAILGPPEMLAEVPAADEASRSFLESCAWRSDVEFTDFVQRESTAGEAPSELVVPITVEELIAGDLLDTGTPCCWARAPKSLINRKDSLKGFAVAPADRIEAYLLHDDEEIVALVFPGSESTPDATSAAWLKLLTHPLAASFDKPLRLGKTRPDEIDYPLLRTCGFEPAGTTLGYAAVPQAG